MGILHHVWSRDCAGRLTKHNFLMEGNVAFIKSKYLRDMWYIERLVYHTDMG